MGPALTLDEATAWLAEQPVTRRWSEPRRRAAAQAAIAAGQAAASRLAELAEPRVERDARANVFAGVTKYAEWDACRGVIVLYEAGVAALAAEWALAPAEVEARLIAHERYHALAAGHGTRAEEELAARVCAGSLLRL